MGKARRKICSIPRKNLDISRRVYLATKKNDEKKCKYAVKVINKADIRKKNLIDQSTDAWAHVRIVKHPLPSSSEWTWCSSDDG